MPRCGIKEWFKKFRTGCKGESRFAGFPLILKHESLFAGRAGEGKRLRPLTLSVPKCLVPIQGKPLLYYWLRLCEMYEVEEILINLHHLPDKVIDFVDQYQGPVKVRLAHEPVLLGSAGTIRENWDFVEKEESFFVFYGDNLTNVNLDAFRRFHPELSGWAPSLQRKMILSGKAAGE